MSDKDYVKKGYVPPTPPQHPSVPEGYVPPNPPTAPPKPPLKSPTKSGVGDSYVPPPPPPPPKK